MKRQSTLAEAFSQAKRSQENFVEYPQPKGITDTSDLDESCSSAQAVATSNSSRFSSHRPEESIAASSRQPAPVCDVGQFYQGRDSVGNPLWEPLPSALPLAEKARLLQEHFRPDRHYRFEPKVEQKKNRRFQLAWLETYPWLVYSEACNGGFCLSCLLFAKTRDAKVGGVSFAQLTNGPLENFTKATDALKNHHVAKVHQDALAVREEFLARMTCGVRPVVDLLADQSAKQGEKNLKKMRSILQCVEFCGRQNIPLRGHRNESNFDARPTAAQDGNPGNFLALLRFRAEAGDDTVLSDFHVNRAGPRITYTSPDIQNDLIDCCGRYIKNVLLEEVKQAPFFTVLADEAVDASTKEQMPIILRFVDAKRVIREEFMDFIHCDHGTTGEALAEKITNKLKEFGLDLGKWRGQGYDGAGNMSGRINGCAAVVNRQYPKALYIHCASHALNLCVMSSTRVLLVSNMWSVLNEVCLFFCYSPKRKEKLAAIIEQLPNELLGNTTKSTLINLCPTRWVARHDALVAFGQLHLAVAATFEDITMNKANWSAESASKAASLLHSITSFSFIATFTITSNVLAYTHALTIRLQGRTEDVGKAYAEVSTVQAALQKVRDNVETYHSDWWKESLVMAEKVSVEPSAPRVCIRQTRRPNPPATTPQEYFRRSVTVPLLDEMLSSFAQRFTALQQKAALGMALVPSVLVAQGDAKENALQFAEAFSADLPAGQSMRTFKAELSLWMASCQSAAEEKTPQEALRRASDNGMLPCIERLLMLACTWPVTTCSCERSISALRRLKTYLRSTMGQDRLNGLALMHTHYGIPLSHTAVLRDFFSRCNRRVIAPRFESTTE